MDEFIKTNNLLPPDFIKIEVESHEYFVLKGLEKTIKTYQPMIFIECFPEQQKKVFPLLESLGYNIVNEKILFIILFFFIESQK